MAQCFLNVISRNRRWLTWLRCNSRQITKTITFTINNSNYYSSRTCKDWWRSIIFLKCRSIWRGKKKNIKDTPFSSSALDVDNVLDFNVLVDPVSPPFPRISRGQPDVNDVFFKWQRYTLQNQIKIQFWVNFIIHTEITGVVMYWNKSINHTHNCYVE